MVLRFGRTFQVVGASAVGVLLVILSMAQTVHVFTDLSSNVASLLDRAYVTDATPPLRPSVSVQPEPSRSSGATHDAVPATAAPLAPSVQGPGSSDSLSATAQSQTAGAADAVTASGPGQTSPRMAASPDPLTDLGATIGSTDDRGADATVGPPPPSQFAEPTESPTVSYPYVFPQAATSASEALAAIADAPAVRAAQPTPRGVARGAAHAAAQHGTLQSRAANARNATPPRHANGGTTSDGHDGNTAAARVGSIRADIARYNAERAMRRAAADRADPYRQPPPHDWPYSR
ncbi:MAG TPA: hypothetical protein VGO84_05950 [Burkholderiales bacterium]|jgi:hypothetical protein|nr:hypothetical protein [Burkholderiales bacterium]